jgi:hypothetical protein
MCCSRPRAPLSAQARRPIRASADPPIFQYAGSTALTVVSPLTRRTYRFERPGMRLEVDARDRSWLAFVPNLSAVP